MAAVLLNNGRRRREYNKMPVLTPFDDCAPIKMDPIQRTLFRSSPTVDRYPSSSDAFVTISLSAPCTSFIYWKNAPSKESSAPPFCNLTNDLDMSCF